MLMSNKDVSCDIFRHVNKVADVILQELFARLIPPNFHKTLPTRSETHFRTRDGRKSIDWDKQAV